MTAALATVVDGLDEDEYHRHLALSSTGARKLLSATPAHFRYWADHPQPRKRAFDLGHATHKKVLGVGAELVPIDAADYRTKKAQQERDAAYDAGQIPLLPDEMDRVDAMVAAVRANRYAATLFDPDHGRPEQSLFWIDDETGAPLRARLDWLPNSHGGRRMVIPDLKTCRSASRTHLTKAIYDYGYFIQAPFYMAAVRALGRRRGRHGGRGVTSVYKAQPTVRDKPVADLALVATSTFPDLDPVEARNAHDADAQTIVAALLASLPGGTVDTVLRLLLEHRASLLRVTWPRGTDAD